MQKFLFAGVSLFLLCGCGADNPQSKTEPQASGTATVHSLSIKIRKGTENSVIGGMWYLPQNVRRAFFYSGKLDGKSPLKDPIFKSELPVQCVDAGCRDFTFTLTEPETGSRVVMSAHAFDIASGVPKSDPALPTTPVDYRVYWQRFLAGELDLPSSSVVLAQTESKKYLSTTLVGILTPTFHLYTPSEGEPKVAFDYQTHDSAFYGAGHAEGGLTLGRGEARVRLPGGQLTLSLK